MDGADKSLLDRELSLKSVENYNFSFNLLNELLDYGTHLLPKALNNSPGDIKALCIICVQFRQILAHLDGIAVLIAAGNSFSATLQLRSLLEIALAMEWLVKSDTEAKVNHLYVANLRRRRKWQSAAIPGTPEAARHGDALKRLPLSAESLEQIKKEVAGIDKILADQKLYIINTKFEQNYVKNNYDKPWYEIYGISSIRKIADDLGKTKAYMHFYSAFSEITHGGDMWKNLSFEKGNFINPIRETAQIVKVAGLATIFIIPVYRMILAQYLPTDIPDFNKKYKNEWRTRYLYATKLKY